MAPARRNPLTGRYERSAGPGGFSVRTGGQIGGRGVTGLTIDRSFFEAIENSILHCYSIQRGLPVAMDRLVRFASYVHLGYAQKRSLGPIDPRQQRPELAWRVPVRRITGRYFFAWKVKRVGLGHYQMLNDSREGFYIEYGIHRNPYTGKPSPRRIRRPVMKLALIDTLKFMEHTHVGHRIWSGLYMPPPGKRTGRGFIWRMQSPAMMGPLQITGQKLPG